MASVARQQAQAEGLTLLVAKNKTGYYGVSLPNPGKPKPYEARVWRGGKDVYLGSFATAEEAALCIARSLEGQAAAERPAAAAPLTSEEARQQAKAKGLTLLVAKNKAGFFGVTHHPSQPKPYEARVSRGDTRRVHLGYFATAEEVALRVARSLEGQAAAEQAAVAPPPTSEEERKGPIAKEEGVVPPMPPDAYVKVEVVVKEEEGSGSRPKRQRTE